ncbi:MAG: ComF family protein [Candidatus Cloacimonadota bacterium]|nr:ComF family protein [Candidatus Cloacimonadota bacterium]
MNYWQAFLNLVYPKTCINCNCRIYNSSEFLCSECKQQLTFLENNLCPKCGSPNKNNDCDICKNFHFHKARSVFPFNKTVRSLIHYLKYNEFIKIADYLAAYCFEYIQKYHPFPQVDIICPVPLYKVRKRSRGFNQAEKISSKIASYAGWNHIPNLLVRKKYTATQTKLSKIERNLNVRDAFELNSKYEIKDKNILVIDDVFTTGSTVNSIGKVLEKYGVSKIYVLTIARA